MTMSCYSRWALTALASLPIGACGGSAETPASDDASAPKVGAEAPATPNGILLDFELTDRRRRALSGEARPAYDLFRHFQQSGDPVEAERWARIGAENGELRSMMFLAYLHEKEGGVEGCLRAIFWLKRSQDALKENARDGGPEGRSASVEYYISDIDADIARVRRSAPGCQ